MCQIIYLDTKILVPVLVEFDKPRKITFPLKKYQTEGQIHCNSLSPDILNPDPSIHKDSELHLQILFI